MPITRKVHGYDEMKPVHATLGPEEWQRYLRQLAMADWSEEDQLKLKRLHVTVLGIGGAASSILNNLLLLGVGTVEVFDNDVVELSNLNRQFVHTVEHLGMSKAESFGIYARRLNPNVEVVAKQVRIDDTTCEKNLNPHTDVIIDTFDKWSFRFIVNRFAVERRIPYLLAGVVSNCFYTSMLHTPDTPCLSCLLGRFQRAAFGDAFQTSIFPINILPLTALGSFSLAELIKYVKGGKPSNQFYFGSLYSTPQDIRFFSLFLSKHFRKISEQQGVHWGSEWTAEGITKVAISRDPDCPICGK
jgi:molybdopterin/thiamine biosynthesis adenylyltransferase